MMQPEQIIIGRHYILSGRSGVWLCDAHSYRKVAKTHSYKFSRFYESIWEVHSNQVERTATNQEIVEDVDKKHDRNPE